MADDEQVRMPSEFNQNMVRVFLCMFGLGVFTLTAQAISKRSAENEASAIEARDLAFATSGTTTEDARDWLEENGYRVMLWKRGDSESYVARSYSSDGKFNVVRGYKQLRPGGWLFEPSWHDLSFRFSTKGVFHSTRSNVKQFDLSWLYDR